MNYADSVIWFENYGEGTINDELTASATLVNDALKIEAKTKSAISTTTPYQNKALRLGTLEENLQLGPLSHLQNSEKRPPSISPAADGSHTWDKYTTILWLFPIQECLSTPDALTSTWYLKSLKKSAKLKMN